MLCAPHYRTALYRRQTLYPAWSGDSRIDECRFFHFKFIQQVLSGELVRLMSARRLLLSLYAQSARRGEHSSSIPSEVTNE